MIVQPCRRRVIGTRFFVRLSVARAYSPLGCQATPSSRFESGTAIRRATLCPATSNTVTSETGAVRKPPRRESAFVTKSVRPSGESAAEATGCGWPARSLRLLAGREVDEPTPRRTQCP